MEVLPPFITGLVFVTHDEFGSAIGRGRRLKAHITAPRDSPYSRCDYAFPLDVMIDDEYPRLSPRLRFACIFDHFNVTELGTLQPATLLLDTWDARSSVINALYTVHRLMAAPVYPKMFSEDEADTIWRMHAERVGVTTLVSSCFPVPPAQYLTLDQGSRLMMTMQLRDNVMAKYRAIHEQGAERMISRYETAMQWRAMTSHPFLYDDQSGWNKQWFAPSLLQALQANTPQAISSIVTEEAPGVFSFDIFTPEFCHVLLEEIRQFEASALPKTRPNSMNNYGVVLNDIGMEGMFTRLVAEYIQPMAAALLAEATMGLALDHHHSFVVTYKEGQDLSLDMHTDDSDVTLNVNICDAFTGAGLLFCGLYGTMERRQHSLEYQHRLGRAVIHSGLHTRGADELITGERHNIIVWCRSSQFRQSEAFHHRYTRPTLPEYEPDRRCLSKTHDQDYHHWIQELVPAQSPQ